MRFEMNLRVEVDESEYPEALGILKTIALAIQEHHGQPGGVFREKSKRGTVSGMLCIKRTHEEEMLYVLCKIMDPNEEIFVAFSPAALEVDQRFTQPGIQFATMDEDGAVIKKKHIDSESLICWVHKAVREKVVPVLQEILTKFSMIPDVKDPSELGIPT